MSFLTIQWPPMSKLQIKPCSLGVLTAYVSWWLPQSDGEIIDKKDQSQDWKITFPILCSKDAMSFLSIQWPPNEQGMNSNQTVPM